MYDIIHLQNLPIQPLIASNVASRIYDENVVITVHNPPSWNKMKIERRLTKILLASVKAIVSVYRWVDKKISQISSHSVEYYLEAHVGDFDVGTNVDFRQTNCFNFA
jgi:hypothetical protein